MGRVRRGVATRGRGARERDRGRALDALEDQAGEFFRGFGRPGGEFVGKLIQDTDDGLAVGLGRQAALVEVLAGIESYITSWVVFPDGSDTGSVR